MRLYEIAPQMAGEILTEEMIREGFLDSIKKKVGAMIDDNVSVVRNMNTALVVIYRVIKNSEYLELVTYQLKKTIKDKLKLIQSDLLQKTISKIFPQGRGMKDFLISLCIVGVINTVIEGAISIKDTVVDSIKDSLIQIPNLLGNLIDISGLTSILNALKISNSIFFELLSKIDKKLDGAI